jgi:asparagine synthase (glutamine-hydrolysing)
VADSVCPLARHYDQPFGNSSALPAYHCAKLAKENGVEVLLAGDGGDELFAGNTRYAKQRVFAAYHEIPNSIRSSVIEPLLLGVRGFNRVPVVKKLVSYVQQARLQMPDRLETYNLLERIGVPEVLETSFIESIDPTAPLASQRATYAESGDIALINRMLAYDWKYTLADNDLPKVVGTAELAGVTAKFPLLADEVVDFSLALPPQLKLNGVKLRYFFKEALRGFLPEETIAKKKHGFGLPFGVWLAGDNALREFAAASLERLANLGIVRREFVRALLGARLSEHAVYYGEMVWILLMLSEWLQLRATGASLPSSEA